MGDTTVSNLWSHYYKSSSIQDSLQVRKGRLKFIFTKSISGFMPSDISGTIELDLANEHNLIIQPMASPTGQLIQFSGTIPLQTHPGNLIKFQIRGSKGIINVIGSSNEANVQTMRTPETSNIFNSLIENIRSSDEVDKEQIVTLLEVLRDNLTAGSADNQDLVERLKRISADKQKFENIWTKTSPLILKSIKEVINSAIMRPSQ